MDVLHSMATEILVRSSILRAHYKIDKDSSELIATLSELIRLRLQSNSPNFRVIADLAKDINDTIRDAETASQGGIFW